MIFTSEKLLFVRHLPCLTEQWKKMFNSSSFIGIVSTTTAISKPSNSMHPSILRALFIQSHWTNLSFCHPSIDRKIGNLLFATSPIHTRLVMNKYEIRQLKWMDFNSCSPSSFFMNKTLFFIALIKSHLCVLSFWSKKNGYVDCLFLSQTVCGVNRRRKKQLWQQILYTTLIASHCLWRIKINEETEKKTTISDNFAVLSLFDWWKHCLIVC